MPETSSARMTYFDNVRGLLAIGMIICHTIIMYGSESMLQKPLGIFGEWIIGTWPGAPVFMILMGIFFVYPHDRSTSHKFIRGIKLFLLGLILNLIRFVVPYLIALATGSDAFQNIAILAPQEDFPVMWQLFYFMDILTFAGLSIVILAIFDTIFSKDWQWLILALFVVFLSPYMWGTGRDLGNFYPLLQPFWSNSLVDGILSDTAFPVFPWLLYPIIGLLIGRQLSNGATLDTLLPLLVRSSVVLGFVGSSIMLVSNHSQLGDFYRMYPGATLLCAGFGLSWIAMFMILTKHRICQRAFGCLTFWSRNLTLIYLVQWILIGFGVLIFGYRQQDNSWIVFSLIFLFSTLTHITTTHLLNRKKFIRVFNWFTH